MFKEILSEVQNKYKKVQEENKRYQDLLNKCSLLPNFFPYNIDNKTSTISYKPLMNLCPELNDDNAIILRNIIPIDEIIISCIYSIECKTNIKFYFVTTTKYLWLINSTGYLKYNYQDLTIDIIKSRLLTKCILLSNMLFNINGANETLLNFVKLIEDSNNREEIINKQLQTFCNTTPNIYYLNDIASGISIGINNEIVFHTRDFHYKYNIRDIENYELLLDNMVVREKKNSHKNKLTANKNSCYEMIIRITTNDQEFLIPILEKNSFTTLYTATNKEFRENREFANKVIDLLDELDDKLLNGEL